MTRGRWLAVVVLVVLVFTFVKPARAEALEPTLVILIIAGGIVVVALLAVLIIANVTEYQRGIRTHDRDDHVRIVWQRPAPESP